jgi:hypothetical protein
MRSNNKKNRLPLQPLQPLQPLLLLPPLHLQPRAHHRVQHPPLYWVCHDHPC